MTLGNPVSLVANILKTISNIKITGSYTCRCFEVVDKEHDDINIKTIHKRYL